MSGASKLWKGPAEAVLWIALILCVFGTVNIFSASFVQAAKDYSDSYYFVKRHLMMFGIGIVAMLIAAKMDYRDIRRLVLLIMVVTLAALFAVQVAGVTANGAKRWINIGFQFQPSEMAKLATIVLSASYLGTRVDRQWRVSLLSWPVFYCMVMGALILKQPDMGTAVIVSGLCIAMYIVAGLPMQQRILLFFIGALALVYFTFAAAYRADRIEAWLNPWAYQQTIGYQTVQSLLAIGSGGFFGAGLGMGSSKFYYLPEAHTDFAFAVLCQEMGFVGGVTILVLLVALGLYGGQIARQAADGFGRMLAIGLVFLIVGQAIVNIAMVTGVLPVIGVPLPFISFGGTSLIVNLTAIGILVSVGRRPKPLQAETAPVPADEEGEGDTDTVGQPRKRLQLANRKNRFRR